MKEEKVFELLAKCLNVPRLAFGANTVEPYKELQYITEKASMICTLMCYIKNYKVSSKLYKDDPETSSMIRECINNYNVQLTNICNELDRFYTKRTREEWS